MTPPEDNPWKNSVVNIEFKDMSNRLFNFGPVPWPGSKENVAQGQSSWGSAGTSISTGVQGLNKFRSCSKFRSSTGSACFLRVQAPSPNHTTTKEAPGNRLQAWRHPTSQPCFRVRPILHAEYIVVSFHYSVDAPTHETVTHLNGTVYHELAGVCTPCDTTVPGIVEKLLKIANDDVPKILNQRRFASIKSNLRATLIIRDLEKDDPLWHFLDFDRGLYIEPNPAGIENAGKSYEAPLWNQSSDDQLRHSRRKHNDEVLGRSRGFSYALYLSAAQY